MKTETLKQMKVEIVGLDVSNAKEVAEALQERLQKENPDRDVEVIGFKAWPQTD